MKKRGQVTIFIIVAIILVSIGILFFVFKDNLNVGENSLEIEPIQNQVQYCLDRTSEEGINYVALHGGYYNIPKEIKMSYITYEAPYYYINSVVNIPSIVRIENEIENYIIDNLKYCINYSLFEEQGFVINEGNLSASVYIREDKINVKITYPLSIKKGEATSRLSDFKVEIVSNINKLHIASGEIVNSYKENPGFVCLNCLEEVSNKYNVEAKATPLPDEKVIWFSILDSESELNWKFAVENE